jgi:hypothetical protein
MNGVTYREGVGRQITLGPVGLEALGFPGRPYVEWDEWPWADELY